MSLSFNFDSARTRLQLRKLRLVPIIYRRALVLNAFLQLIWFAVSVVQMKFLQGLTKFETYFKEVPTVVQLIMYLQFNTGMITLLE